MVIITTILTHFIISFLGLDIDRLVWNKRCLIRFDLKNDRPILSRS